MYKANSKLYLKSIENVPELMWAYLAGMIDGEGHIKIYRNSSLSRTRHYVDGWRRQYILTITNTSVPLLNQIHEKIKIGKVKEYHSNTCQSKKEKRYTAFLLFEANEIRALLPKIIPYLILKKELAEIMQKSLKIGEEESGSNRGEKLKAVDVEFYYAFLRTKENRPYRNNSLFWNKKRSEKGRSPTVTLLD